MKIAIYGISRSGKDYQISNILAHLENNGISAVHVPGSTKLNELSGQYFNCKFKLLPQDKKCYLREEFVKILSHYESTNKVVLVDGHYAFPNQEGFDVVFTEADKFCYDHFFYLDSDTELIINNFRKSEGQRKNTKIQAQDVNTWKALEIKALSKECLSLNKELVILDEDIKTCAEFVLDWVRSFDVKYNYQEVVKDLVKREVATLPPNASKEALVVDCDNTFAINDTTYDFCKYLGIKKILLKQIFAGDRYSSYQFFKANKLYSQFDEENRKKASSYAKDKIEISPDLQSLVHKGNYSLVVALTAGLTEIWHPKIQEIGNVNNLWGNSSACSPKISVTPFFKKCFVKELKSNDFSVTSIGDSIIDIPMLECSDHGLIVAHNKINQAVMDYFKEKNESKIAQIFTKEWIYPTEQITGVI